MNAETPPTPGQTIIRPTRSSAEKHSDDFYTLLEALRGPETLPLRKIAEISGDTSLNPEPNILRKIKSRTLSDDARKFLLRHIFDDERLVSGKAPRQLSTLDDALYFSFLNYFNVRDTPQDDARAHVTGTYKFWRYSVEHEGEFVLGKLTCFEDPQTRALKIDVVMRRNAEDGVRRTCGHFSGYLFSVEPMYLSVVRQPVTNEVRMTLYPHYRMNLVGTEVNPRSVFAGKQNHVVLMDGLMIGVDGRSCFHSPVHLSLVDDVDELAALDDLLDVVPEGDARIPQRVVSKLKRLGPLKRL
jgi:hypothetical protein